MMSDSPERLEWICEALADIASALEPGRRSQAAETAREIAMHLERIGDELARLNCTLEGIAGLMALMHVRKSLEAGKNLADPLKETDVFPGMVTQMMMEQHSIR